MWGVHRLSRAFALPYGEVMSRDSEALVVLLDVEYEGSRTGLDEEEAMLALFGLSKPVTLSGESELKYQGLNYERIDDDDDRDPAWIGDLMGFRAVDAVERFQDPKTNVWQVRETITTSEASVFRSRFVNSLSATWWSFRSVAECPTRKLRRTFAKLRGRRRRLRMRSRSVWSHVRARAVSVESFACSAGLTACRSRSATLRVQGQSRWTIDSKLCMRS